MKTLGRATHHAALSRTSRPHSTSDSSCPAPNSPALATKVAVVAVGIALIVTGCGDDTTEDVSGYCDATVAHEATSGEIFIGGDGTDLDGYRESFRRLTEAAPPDAASALREHLDELDADGEDAYASPKSYAAEEKWDETVEALCLDGLDVIEVSTHDYYYDGMPETIPAGRVAIRLTNTSESGDDHEMLLFRINDAVDLTIDELLGLPPDEALAMVTGVGAIESAAEGTDRSDFSLFHWTPGRYLGMSFLPVGGDGGPQVFEEGMLATFTVE